ncbi:hypothetical protein KGM_204073A, partial [Danaus plexippus plexippus]
MPLYGEGGIIPRKVSAPCTRDYDVSNNFVTIIERICERNGTKNERRREKEKKKCIQPPFGAGGGAALAPGGWGCIFLAVPFSLG